MKGKRDSCGHEDSLRASMLFRAPASEWDERSESELSESTLTIFLSFSLRHCWWKFERFSVARFTSHRFSVSLSFLSREFSESVYPRTLSGSSVVPQWTLVGRLILKRASGKVRRSVCRRVTSSLTFGTLDLSDIIITELNPKWRDCNRRTKFNRRFTFPVRNPVFRESWISRLYKVYTTIIT